MTRCYILDHGLVSNGALCGHCVAALLGVVVSTAVLTWMTAWQALLTVGSTLEVERSDTAWHRLHVTTARQSSLARLAQHQQTIDR